MTEIEIMLPDIPEHRCANMPADDELLYSDTEHTWKYYSGAADVFGRECGRCPVCGMRLDNRLAYQVEIA